MFSSRRAEPEMGLLAPRSLLMRTMLATIFGVSIFSAVANAAVLAMVDPMTRLRETASYYTVRHFAEAAGINMLAMSPRIVHRLFDLHVPLQLVRFAAGTAAINLVLLGFAGSVLGCLLLALRHVLTRHDRAGSILERWYQPVFAALLFAPLLAMAGNWLLLLLPRSFPFAHQRALALGSGGVLILATAALMRGLCGGRRHCLRIMVYAGALPAVPLLAALGFPEAGSTADRPMAQKGAPNILLISIDTLRPDHLSCYGYRRITSPTLDRLAQEGAIFLNAFAPASWTLPSHMTLLTSLPPERHSVNFDTRKLAGDIPTLAEVLRARGYVTAGFVSGSYLDGRFGFARGFDEYDDYSLVRLSGLRARFQVSSPTIARLATEYLTRWSADRERRPFFLFLHFFDVHDEYIPPRPYDSLFRVARPADANGQGAATPERPRSGGALEELVARYDGEIAWTDAHVGLILQKLKRLGILNDTVVVVTSDHGEEFYEHGQLGHRRTLYDEVLRVPLLIRFPKLVPAGTRVEHQVRLMDVMPTILLLAGFRVASSGQPVHSAHNLTPLFAGGAPVFPELPAFGQFQDRLSSVRMQGFLYVRNERSGHEELYDLSNDPGQQSNTIAASPSANFFRSQLALWKDFCAGRRSTGQSHELDEDQKKALRSLGYLQ